MSFKVDTSGSQQASNNTANKSTVDYAGMNAEVISILGTQAKGKVVVGFPSGYIDLGMQPRPDFEQLRDENDADQNKALSEGKASIKVQNFYDNGKTHRNVEVFCNPRTAAKAFTLAVDFPQYSVDKGKYFGDSNEAPYRMYMGGEWSQVDPEDGAKKMRIVQNHMYMTENTNNPQGEWALGTGTTISKMCVAAGLGDDNGLVSKDDITGVLGEAMMFNIRVWEKPAKNDASKTYFTETIKFAGEVPEALIEHKPEFDESYIHGVNFNQANDAKMLQQVRFTAKNTMKLAEDWEGSVIKKEIAKAKDDWKKNKQAEDASASAGEVKPDKVTTSTAKEVSVPDEATDFENDVPF